ncbi:NAD-dependent epimerase [Salinicoccus hispanicus]|uniref:NAD-dependent epimerase/dehydratase family protein n=1 Tax=Salinicoccus hispanicus TaxID=157225 RepID=A0A6N8U3H3_9STAP|nr:NAD-dependent epimerase [Salinicoccus hispanicus]MXQ50975.1 NAD-dependent epimerase/dehydratase family protein [Salinicoccus hispanicus]
MKILVTGSAGFIGMHLSIALIEKGHDVIGYDNMNSYYNVELKEERLKVLKSFPRFKFYKADLNDFSCLDNCMKEEQVEIIINLAAQAGVRYSISNPQAYIDSNISGFLNVLEVSKKYKIKHLIYASSSSVYGGNTRMPFSTEDSVDHPVSLYATTKKTNELMAHTYSHLYNIPTSGLRFFTVYGPYGRPDMAYFSFAENITNDKEIKIFNQGDMMRDFTYIDDIVDGIIGLLDKVPEGAKNWKEVTPNPSFSYAPYKVYNIGNNQPVKLLDFINTLEKHLGKEAKKNYVEMQPGDVRATFANIDEIQKVADFYPSTTIDEGLKKFVDWYEEFYNVK